MVMYSLPFKTVCFATYYFCVTGLLCRKVNLHNFLAFRNNSVLHGLNSKKPQLETAYLFYKGCD